MHYVTHHRLPAYGSSASYKINQLEVSYNLVSWQMQRQVWKRNLKRQTDSEWARGQKSKLLLVFGKRLNCTPEPVALISQITGSYISPNPNEKHLSHPGNYQHLSKKYMHRFVCPSWDNGIVIVCLRLWTCLQPPEPHKKWNLCFHRFSSPLDDEEAKFHVLNRMKNHLI